MIHDEAGNPVDDPWFVDDHGEQGEESMGDERNFSAASQHSGANGSIEGAPVKSDTGAMADTVTTGNASDLDSQLLASPGVADDQADGAADDDDHRCKHGNDAQCCEECSEAYWLEKDRERYL